jgi:hypothetical protein
MKNKPIKEYLDLPCGHGWENAYTFEYVECAICGEQTPMGKIKTITLKEREEIRQQTLKQIKEGFPKKYILKGLILTDGSIDYMKGFNDGVDKSKKFINTL